MKCGSNTGMTVCSRSPWLESAFIRFILSKNESEKADGEVEERSGKRWRSGKES